MAGTSQAIDLEEEPSLEHLPGDWEQLSETSRHGWILSWHEKNRGKRLCPHCLAINAPQYVQQMRGKRSRLVDNAYNCKCCLQPFCLNCGDKLRRRAAAGWYTIVYHAECGRTPSWLEAHRGEVGLSESDERVQQPPRASSAPGTSAAAVPHGTASAGDGVVALPSGEVGGEGEGGDEAEIEAEQGETTDEDETHSEGDDALGSDEAEPLVPLPGLEPAGASEQPTEPDAEVAAEPVQEASNAAALVVVPANSFQPPQPTQPAEAHELSAPDAPTVERGDEPNGAAGAAARAAAEGVRAAVTAAGTGLSVDVMATISAAAAAAAAAAIMSSSAAPAPAPAPAPSATTAGAEPQEAGPSSPPAEFEADLPDTPALTDAGPEASGAGGSLQPSGPRVTQREVADLTGGGPLTGSVVKEEPVGSSSGARRSSRNQAAEQGRMQDLNREVRATPTRVFVELNCGEGSLSKQVVLEPGWVAKLIDRNNVVKWTDDFQPGEKATFLQLDIDTISDERWREIAGCASWIHAAPSCTTYGWQTQGNEMRHLNPGGRGSTPEADAADKHVRKILHLFLVARNLNPEILLSLENPNATIGMTDAIKFAMRNSVFRYEDTLNYCMHDSQAPWKSSVLYHDCEPLHDEYKDGKCVCEQNPQSKKWRCGAIGRHPKTVAGMTPQEAAAYPEKVAVFWAKYFVPEAKKRIHQRAANAAAPSQWLSV